MIYITTDYDMFNPKKPWPNKNASLEMPTCGETCIGWPNGFASRHKLCASYKKAI